MLAFAKEYYFGKQTLADETTRHKTLTKLLKSPVFMAGFFKRKSFSKPKRAKTRFLSFNPNELCDTLNKILQEKRAESFYHN